MYLNILTNHLLPFANGQYEEGRWVLHQDNDPKHTSRLCRGFLEREQVVWVILAWILKLKSYNRIRKSKLIANPVVVVVIVVATSIESVVSGLSDFVISQKCVFRVKKWSFDLFSPQKFDPHPHTCPFNVFSLHLLQLFPVWNCFRWDDSTEKITDSQRGKNPLLLHLNKFWCLSF